MTWTSTSTNAGVHDGTKHSSDKTSKDTCIHMRIIMGRGRNNQELGKRLEGSDLKRRETLFKIKWGHMKKPHSGVTNISAAII